MVFHSPVSTLNRVSVKDNPVKHGHFVSGSQDVQDPSVIVNFPLLEDENVCLIAWTTTPWPLPSNLALCVNPEFQYGKVKGKTQVPL